MAIRIDYLDFIKSKFKQHINYEQRSIAERKENVYKFLNDVDDCLTDYYDEIFNVNISSKDNTSSFNPVCRILLKISDYLLSATDIYNEDSFSLEDVFKRKLNKEIPLSSLTNENNENFEIQDNILECLNARIPINKKKVETLLVDEYKKHIINQYSLALEDITNKIVNHRDLKINRYKLTKLKEGLSKDIEYIKKNDYTNLEYKNYIEDFSIKNPYINNSEVISLYDLFDFKEKVVTTKDIKAFKFLCTLISEYKDNFYTLSLREEFVSILNKLDIKPSQKLLISYMKDINSYKDIAEKCNVSKSCISKNIRNLILKFKDFYRYLYIA